MPPKSPLDARPSNLPIFTPHEWAVDLFFFRKCFLRLLQRSKANEDQIPVSHFQKAIMRLYKVLGDDAKARTFDAKKYDPDGSLTIGWAEFCEAWKTNKITIRVSFAERIHLIFDAAGSSQCKLAKWVSYLILLVIFISALSFICGSMEAFREVPASCTNCQGGECFCEPEPKEFFKYIEMLCIIVFTSEYVLKLLTAHAMRTELTRHSELLELVCGELPIHVQTGLERTFNFIREPSNVIDVLAILPYFLEPLMTDMNFNLTFLRLIRLTRIFRIVRLGKMSDAADMLGETLQRSAPSLYVLGFFIVLGIVVCSSIVYFCESGEWDRDSKQYNRKGIFGDAEATPFTSIPATIWWTLVTVTTVGYGDLYPTSTLGKVTGSITIVMGVIAFAMPIGVISSNFGHVWDAHEEAIKTEEEARRKEEKAIIAALGLERQERTAILFEVYDDDGVTNLKLRAPHFLGEVSIDVSALNFTSDSPKQVKVQVPLENNRSKGNVSVTGTLHCVLHWMPESCLENAEDGTTQPRAGVHAPTPITITTPPLPPVADIWEEQMVPQLVGLLTVEVQHATGLLNLDTRLSGLADPFCNLTVYTHFSDPCDESCPPASQGDLDTSKVTQPVFWQTQTIRGSLDPQWHEKKAFHFDWRNQVSEGKTKKKVDGEGNAKTVQDVDSKGWATHGQVEDSESFPLSFPAEHVASLQAETKKWKEAFEALHKDLKGRPATPIDAGHSPIRRIQATRKVQQIVAQEEQDGFHGQGVPPPVEKSSSSQK